MVWLTDAGNFVGRLQKNGERTYAGKCPGFKKYRCILVLAEIKPETADGRWMVHILLSAVRQRSEHGIILNILSSNNTIALKRFGYNYYFVISCEIKIHCSPVFVPFFNMCFDRG